MVTSTLTDRARTAYQQVLDSKGQEHEQGFRVQQANNRDRLVNLLDKLLAIQIGRAGIYFKRFDATRPHAYIDELEFTCQFVPVYHTVVLQLVQQCPACKEEKLDVVGSLTELGAALADGPKHFGCRPACEDPKPLTPDPIPSQEVA